MITKSQVPITKHSLASKARGCGTGRLQVDFGFFWLSFLRKQESRTKKLLDTRFRGYDKMIGSFPRLAHVHSIHISLVFASPEGEGLPPSPMETLNNEQNSNDKKFKND
jgi:hypothetical protein